MVNLPQRIDLRGGVVVPTVTAGPKLIVDRPQRWYAGFAFDKFGGNADVNDPACFWN